MEDIRHQEREAQAIINPHTAKPDIQTTIGLDDFVAPALALGVIAPRQFKVKPEGKKDTIAHRYEARGALVFLLVGLVVQLIHEVVQAEICTEVPPRGKALGEESLQPYLLLCPDILRGHDGLRRPERICDRGEVVVELGVREVKREAVPHIAQDKFIANLWLEEGVPLPIGQLIKQILKGVKIFVAGLILAATIQQGYLALLIEGIGDTQVGEES